VLGVARRFVSGLFGRSKSVPYQRFVDALHSDGEKRHVNTLVYMGVLFCLCPLRFRMLRTTRPASDSARAQD
jgi:hypothetical protein